MKRIISILLASFMLSSAASANKLNLLNAYAISENVTIEACLEIAEAALNETGLKISSNPEGMFFRATTSDIGVLAEVWCMEIAPGVTQSVSTVVFDESSEVASTIAHATFETIGSIVSPSFNR